MTPDNRFLRLIFQCANFPIDVIATLAGFNMLVAIIVQIVSRWLESPVPWTEEMTRFSFIWMVYLGVGIGFRRVESARVTLFFATFPKCVRNLLPWIYSGFSAGFFVLILFAGVELVRQQVIMTEMGAALSIPMWIVGLSVPVAGLVGVLGVLESMVFHRSRVHDDGEIGS